MDQDVTAYTEPLKRPGIWNANLKIERGWDPTFVEENLEQIQCPTLVVWGENDPWHPLAMAHTFTQRIEKAQLKVFSRCGHLPH
jgi:pimeloyl-ACP methyl ester carboxylesterase